MESLKFEFGKYTEITDLALELNPSFKEEGYIRFFICTDTWDFWFARILEGFNEDYERQEGYFLLERDKIAKSSKKEIITLETLKKLIENHDGSNWDIEEGRSIEELIEMIDDGFGILNLKEQ